MRWNIEDNNTPQSPTFARYKQIPLKFQPQGVIPFMIKAINQRYELRLRMLYFIIVHE